MAGGFDIVGLMARDDSIHCQTERAYDYYGLGVRLGVYFAWLSGYLANVALPSEFGPASDTNTIFLLTLLISMANDSRTRELGRIDGLILMHLCGGTVFGILSVWGYRTRRYLDRGPRAVRLFGGFGTQIRLAVSLGVSVYGLWFWLYGVVSALRPMGPDDGMEPPNPPECGVLYTFFFAKVRADSGIRIYYTIVSASCVAYFGIMFLVSSLSAWFSFDSIIELFRFKSWSDTNRAKYATGFTHKELSVIFKFLRVANLIWLIFSAMMVEFTLNFNNVSGVLGGDHDGGLHLPGQLLPFLVGVFSFIRVCYQLFKERWETPEMGSSTAGARTDHPQAYEPALQSPASPGPPIRYLGDEVQKSRSWPVRYLIAWLPWLGLVLHSNRQSRVSTLIRGGTGLSQFSQIDEELTGQGGHKTRGVE